MEARRRRRPLPGRDHVGPPERRPARDRREDRHPRDRRRRAPVHGDDERLRLHRRRHGPRASGRGRAQGHGDDAVPPDDARADRSAHHRGLPRRGRIPPERRQRALPRPLRPERDGARLARRHLPCRADGDRRGPRHRRQRPARPAAPRRREDPRAPARDARALDDLRRRRPDLRADPRPAGCPLPHGRRRHRRVGADRARGPLRRRRGRVRLGARCEPPRRERAHGDDHVREARRPARIGVGAREHDRDRAGVRSGRRRAGARRRCSTGPTASVPGRSATSSPRRCT